MPEDDTSAWTPIKEPPVKAPPLKVEAPKEGDIPSEDTSAWTPVPEVKAAKLSPKEEEDKKKKEEEDLKTKKLGPYSIFNRNRAMEHLPSADQVIDFLRPIVAPVVGGTVGTASALAASPLTPAVSVPFGMASGAGAYALTDALMQRMRSQPENSYASKAAGFEPGGIASTLTNTAEMAAGGKALEWVAPKVLRGVLNAVKEQINPGAVVGDAYKLNPTFSQWKGIFGKGPGPARWIEDTLDGFVKRMGQKESLSIGRKMAGGEDYNPNTSYAQIQEDLRSANMTMKAASNDFGNKAIAISENNPHTVMVADPNYRAPVAPPPSPITLTGTHLNPAAPIQAPAQSGLIPATISGPIDINKAYDASQEVIKDLEGRLSKKLQLTDDDVALREVAQKIIDKVTVVDPATGAIHRNPLSMRDAWDLKKMADELAYNPSTVAKNDPINLQVPSSTQRYFRNLSQRLNDDIDASMPKWANDPQQKGVAAWQNAKAVAGQRQILLNTQGSNIKKMINDTTTSLPMLDAIVNDPKEMRRVLAAGQLRLPGGARVITTTREDLGSYKIKQLFSDMTKADPNDPSRAVFNGSGLIDAWNDPKFADSRKALFSRDKIEGYSRLFKNLAETQIKGSGVASRAGLWTIRGGVALAPNLALGHLTAPTLGNAAVTGVGIGATVLAKMMNDPKSARIMAAAASGEALDASYDYVARLVARAAQGGTMTLFTSDGKSTKMDVDSDGKMTESH